MTKVDVMCGLAQLLKVGQRDMLWAEELREKNSRTPWHSQGQAIG